MLRTTLLLGALLSLSMAASAQDRVVSFAPPVPAAPPTPPDLKSYTEDQWQIAFAYQYDRLNVTGKPFNTNGFDLSFLRYFNNWIGLEAVTGAGFGNTRSSTNPPNLDAKTIFAGGGFHLARRRGRVEPFVHEFEGMEYFRFTQASALLGSHPVFAWDAGGGFDFHVNEHAAFRTEADYLGTRLGLGVQRHFQAMAGWVMNF